VERTVPFGLICFSVVTLWYALHGHAPHDVTSRRARARWYTTKTEPSYDDMARQTSPRHHRREISQSMTRAGHPARNPGRPRSLGLSWDLINKNCETRG
jgi:hypothetical protein